MRIIEPGSMTLAANSIWSIPGAVGDGTDPAQAATDAFDCDHDGRLVGSAWLPGGSAADEDLVELDDTAEHVPVRADHRPAQLLHPRPRGLVGAEAERPSASPSADTPFFCAVTNQAAANHVDNGVCER